MSSPDYSQAVADILDGLGESPTPDEVYHAVKNYSVDYVVAATAATAKAGGGGGGGGSLPVTLTLTAAEIAARWSVSVGGAYVAWPAITTDTRVLSFAARENTLDEAGQPGQYLYAYLADADSDAVDAGSGAFIEAVSATVPSTYHSLDTLPPLVVDGSLAAGAIVGQLLDGSAAYVLMNGDAAPTTGEITLELFTL